MLGALAQKAAPARPRPNILFLMADDLASWMLGCYGNKEIKTPNIDRLAQSGVRFVNHAVCTPICSASRATFFTGRTPMQHGIQDFLSDSPIANPPQGQKEIPDSFAKEIHISDVLSQNGYQCGYVGKWHMGGESQLGHGYQYSCTTRGGSGPYQDPTLFLNGKQTQEKGYLAEILTRRAIEFLDQRDKSKPYFLTVSYTNPHTPYDGHPQKYYDLYANSNFETFGWESAAPNALREKEYLNDTVGNLRKCAATVTALDDQIGALFDRVLKAWQTENTLVIFTGDNGYLLGRHGLWSKGLASDPINMYEEVMQVPMIWSWAGQIPIQSSRAELVSAYDFVPSVCDAAGVQAPARNLCGLSYLPMAQGKIRGKKDKPWRSTIFGHFRNTEMARDGRFKVIVRDGGESPGEFYDLAKDPRERANLYGNPQYVSVQSDLTQQLKSWREKYSA